MKNKLILGMGIFIAALIGLRLFAAEGVGQPSSEYVTIHWDGRDNTHLIRAGGKVESIREELRKLPKPGGADERSFYMNAAINGLAAQGYELAAMTSDEAIMRRGR